MHGITNITVHDAENYDTYASLMEGLSDSSLTLLTTEFFFRVNYRGTRN